MQFDVAWHVRRDNANGCVEGDSHISGRKAVLVDLSIALVIRNVIGDNFSDAMTSVSIINLPYLGASSDICPRVASYPHAFCVEETCPQDSQGARDVQPIMGQYSGQQRSDC